tara:strand:- start:271 stop:843 length:573 start_codon:yes stop_codon:yes gene_type:complete
MWSRPKKNNTLMKTNMNVNKYKQNRLVIKNSNNKPAIKSGMGTKAFWGTPTWILFHSLAEKVNERKYANHYMTMWNFIKEVCAALPCPFCRTHAINYTNSVPITNINTKEKLITTLFNFHNDVNLRTGKSLVSRSVLTKYKSSNLKNILKLFNERFFVSYIGRRQFDDWIKNKTRKSTEVFWNFYTRKLL